MKKFLLFFILFLILFLSAEQVKKPYTFQPGGVIKSNEVNANFDVLYNLVNGNLDGSNIRNNSIPKTKLIGYPFTGYTDLIDETIYDTQIAPLANIHYTKLFGVVDRFTDQFDINGLKRFLVIPQIDSDIASDTENYQYDNQLVCKKYVDWKVSLAGGGGSYPGNYPIQSSDISDYTIKDTDIDSNTLTSRVIQDGAITTSKIQDNSITETKIQNGAITTSKIQDNSITTSKIQDNAITGTKIRQGVITTEHIANLTIQTEDLADNIITTFKIQDNAITETKIQNGAITTSKIQDNSITETKIQNGAITEDKLSDNSVSTNKIQNGSITASKIAVLSDKIYYETTTLIDNTSPDTTIVHKKYVDEAISSSISLGSKYYLRDYVKEAILTYSDNVENPENCRDRNRDTYARLVASSSRPSYIIFDLKTTKFIYQISYSIFCPCEIAISNDGVNWNTIISSAEGTATILVLRNFRYLRIYRDSEFYAMVYEVLIVGTEE